MRKAIVTKQAESVQEGLDDLKQQQVGLQTEAKQQQAVTSWSDASTTFRVLSLDNARLRPEEL